MNVSFLKEADFCVTSSSIPLSRVLELELLRESKNNSNSLYCFFLGGGLLNSPNQQLEMKFLMPDIRGFVR